MDVLTSIAAFYLNRHWFDASPDLAAQPVKPVLVRLAVAGACLALFVTLLGGAAYLEP